jgi:hypothetical protein
MKFLLLLFILTSTQAFSQDFSKEKLWKGYTVCNPEGKEIRYKRQDFIKFKEKQLLLFQFQELMSMTTGEVKIKIVIDTFNISNTKRKDIYQLTNEKDTLRLVKNNSTEFNIFYPRFYLTFKSLDIPESKISSKKCTKYILNNSFSTYVVKTQALEDDMKITYQENGKAKYSDTGSSWESVYKVVEFENYVFIKGITSAPILVHKIKSKKLICTALDYRFEPEEIELRKEG